MSWRCAVVLISRCQRTSQATRSTSFRRQPEPRAERARIVLAQYRMIAAAALGDVVEQAGQQQQLGLAQARPRSGSRAETRVAPPDRRSAPCCAARAGCARRPCRRGTGRTACARTPCRTPAGSPPAGRAGSSATARPPPARRAAAVQEGRQHVASSSASAVAMRRGGLVDAAHGVGAEAEQLGLIQPRQEDLDQRRRPALEQLRIARRDAPAVAARNPRRPATLRSSGSSISSKRSTICTPSRSTWLAAR